MSAIGMVKRLGAVEKEFDLVQVCEEKEFALLSELSFEFRECLTLNGIVKN
jgi:hypothetical protein